MRFTLVFIFLSFTTTLWSQVIQPGRYEIELTPFEDAYNVMSAEDKGVLLYRSMEKFNGSDELWRFVKLDTALTEEWVVEYYFDRDNIYRGYDYQSNYFYFLYQIVDKGSNDLLLIEMNASTGDTTNYRIKNLVPIQLESFEMTPTAAVIGGYYNQDPVVMHYSLATGKTKVLPGIFGSKNDLVQIKIEQDLIKVLLTDRTFDNRNTLALKTYNWDGDYLDDYQFKPLVDTGLIFGRVAEIGNEGSLVCGSYGGRRSEYSRGIFIAHHNMNEDQTLKYLNFADLDNFFSYLKAKRQNRLEDRITRKKVKGKKVKFNYRLLVHDVLKNGDEYIMLGEAFYPKYNTAANYGNFGVPGYSRGYSPSTFAGYRYTHAVVIGFDKNGNRLWDNSFQIEDVLTFSLDQFVHADVYDNKVVLMYLYNNELRTKIVSGSDVLEGKSYNDLKMKFEDDYVSSKTYEPNVGGIEKWYGHDFMAYGIQKIKNLRDSGVKLNRRVFYINKVRYENKPNSESPLNEQSGARN